MPTATICLDCNRLYTTTNQRQTKGRCPTCYPNYTKRQPRGTHHNTPTRQLRTRLYNTTKWRQTRQHILNRDGSCTKCGTHHNLQVHHIHSITDAPERAFDHDNLTTLCRTCHARESNATKRQRRARTHG